MDIVIKLGWLIIAMFLGGVAGWLIGRYDLLDEIERKNRKIESLYEALSESEEQREKLVKELRGKHYG